jgi:hypothetical protein
MLPFLARTLKGQEPHAGIPGGRAALRRGEQAGGQVVGEALKRGTTLRGLAGALRRAGRGQAETSVEDTG